MKFVFFNFFESRILSRKTKTSIIDDDDDDDYHDDDDNVECTIHITQTDSHLYRQGRGGRLFRLVSWLIGGGGGGGQDNLSHQF